MMLCAAADDVWMTQAVARQQLERQREDEMEMIIARLDAEYAAAKAEIEAHARRLPSAHILCAQPVC